MYEYTSVIMNATKQLEISALTVSRESDYKYN